MRRAPSASPLVVPAAALVTAAAWLLAACQGSPDTSLATHEKPNLVLISIDTCRADHLSCYGYERPTTPNIDAVASEGALFERATAAVPLTLPSHSTMLTGTLPPYHGVRDNEGYVLSEANETLAEILKARGYKTAAAVGSFVLDARFGLAQGFDTYDDRMDAGPATPFSGAERRGEEVSRSAVQWLEANREEPFFLFLHYFDPHWDYRPPPPFDEIYADEPYAGEVAYVDHCIGTVLDKLKSLGLYDTALIAIVGDHGESLGQHGEPGHGFFVYESSLRTPFIVRPPGGLKKPRRVADINASAAWL